jgi:hypothetical protein
MPAEMTYDAAMTTNDYTHHYSCSSCSQIYLSHGELLPAGGLCTTCLNNPANHPKGVWYGVYEAELIADEGLLSQEGY